MFDLNLPPNEAVLNYLPNSPERQALSAALDEYQPVTIPLCIGEKKYYDLQKLPLVCPHDHKRELAKVVQAGVAEVQEAISAAMTARETWAALPWEERAAVFLKAADLITGPYRAQINAATMLGQSKTCHQAEIEAACELADFFRFNAVYSEGIHTQLPALHSPKGQRNHQLVRPLEGFVLAIAPFNFTAISLNLACAPALMGCTVLWKPTHSALLASYLGLQILEEAGLPPGVINLVNGDPEMIAAEALASPDLGGVHFTGSTRVFQLLWQQVGQNIGKYRSYPRIVGETGGKDFVFVHPSADVDLLLNSLIRGAFEYQGQKCSAASRLYIPEDLWAVLKPRLCAACAEIKLGDPRDFSNFMAAVIDARAFARISKYIETARQSSDAEIIAGGECDDSKGYFVRPTVIETNDPEYQSMCEEIFGPVLTVYPYRDMDAALKYCESNAYALTGAIFARDRRAIVDMARALRDAAGNFYINDKPSGAVVGQQPFGGARASGTNDKAGSPLNLLRWVSYQSVKENFLPLSDYRYPFMETLL